MADNETDKELAHLPWNTNGFTFMGHHVSPVQYEFLAPEPTGVFQSYWVNMRASGLRALSHWQQLTTMELGGPSVSPDTWNDAVANRDIPYRQGVSRSELQRLVGQYDRQQYLRRFEPDSVVARAAGLAGSITGSTISPASVLTAGIGSRFFTAARLADNLYDTFMYATAGSLFQGSSAAGVTAALRASRGQPVSPERMAINAVASLALDLPIAGISHGTSQLLDYNGARAFADSGIARPDDNPYDAADELKGQPAPPKQPMDTTIEQEAHTRTVQDAMAGVDRYFPEYQGGSRQWLKEVAAGIPSAREKGQSLGFDMQSGALRNAMRNWGRLSDRSSTPPLQYNSQLLQDMRALSPEGRSRLRQNGILTSNDDVREPFEPIFNAATTDPADRTAEQSASVRDFLERGSGPIRAVKRKEIEAQMTPLRKELRDLRDITRTRKKSQRMDNLRKQAKRLSANIRDLDIQRDHYTGAGTNRVLDDSMPDSDVVTLFDTLMRTRPVQSEAPEVSQPVAGRQEPATTMSVPDEGLPVYATGPAEQSTVADEGNEEIQAWFSDKTSDQEESKQEEIDSLLDNLNRSIQQCEAPG